jgi:hypothetical protein
VTNPNLLRQIGGRTLTANPDIFEANNPNLIYDIGYAKGVAALVAPNSVTAYFAVERIGILGLDVGDHTPGATPKKLTAMYEGNFSDIAAYGNDWLVAVGGQAFEKNIVVLDGDLAELGEPIQLRSTNRPKRVRVAARVPTDLNGDNKSTPDEQLDLAVVAAEFNVVFVKLADGTKPASPANPPRVVGSVDVPGTARELEIDPTGLRAYVVVDEVVGTKLYVIDLTRPDLTTVDEDGDGFDDRILLREPMGGGVNGLRLDSDRGLLYVATPAGLDIWRITDLCCDLGVDMTGKAKSAAPTGSSLQLLKDELKALKKGITQGIALALEKCSGFDPTQMKLWESGSSACLWSIDPPADEACGSNYQVGVSDHDISTFMPDSWYTAQVTNPFKTDDPDDHRPGTMSLAACAASIMAAPFTDLDDPDRRPNDIDGFRFDDISFLPNFSEDLPSMRYRLARTVPGEGDNDNDLGLGRQLLVMKHMTEAYGVDLSDVDLTGIEGVTREHLTAVTVTEAQIQQYLQTFRESARIPFVEGFEWSHLMEFLFVKGKTLLRIKNGADEASQFHKFFVKQLHSAGKTGIRTAAARMVANKASRDLFMAFKRTKDDPATVLPPETDGDVAIPLLIFRGDGANACFEYDATQPDPTKWAPGECGSMEEYAAATAIRTLTRVPADQRPFTLDEVKKIIRFYRVKSDEEHVRTDAEADQFVADVYQFIKKVQNDTEAIYNANRDTVALDTQPDPPDPLTGETSRAALRTQNMQYKIKRSAEVTKAKIHVLPHVYNRSFQNVDQISLRAYHKPPGGSLAPLCWKNEKDADVCQLKLKLAGGEHAYPDFQQEPDESFQTQNVTYQRSPATEHGEGGEKLPIFVIKADQKQDGNATLGQAGEVSFTVDLPDKTVKEGFRENNYDGFFYYVLDAAAADITPPTTDAKVALPVAGDAIDPDLVCDARPVLEITQIMEVAGTNEEAPIALYLGEQGILKLGVKNTSTADAHDVTLCTTLTQTCFNFGSVAAGTSASAPDITFSSKTPVIVESVPTVFSDVGIMTGAPFEISVGCAGYNVVSFVPDPNPPPDKSEVMIGGRSVRHFQVVDRRTGQPISAATVKAQVSGAQSGTYAFTTDADGEIGTAGGARGLSIPFTSGTPDAVATITLESVNGIPTACDSQVSYDVTLKKFEFAETLRGGGAIGAWGSAFGGLSLGVGTSIAFKLEESASDLANPTPEDVIVTRQRDFEIGAQAKLSLGLEAKVSRGRFGATAKGPSLGATVQGSIATSDEHHFDAGTLANDANEQKKLLFLTLDTLGLAPSVRGLKPLVDFYNQNLAGTLGVAAQIPDFDANRSAQGGGATVTGQLQGSLWDFKVNQFKFKENGEIDEDATVKLASSEAGFVSKQTVGFNLQNRESNGAINRTDITGRYEFETSAAVTTVLPFLDVSSLVEEMKTNIDGDENQPELLKKRYKKTLDSVKAKVDGTRTKLQQKLSGNRAVSGALEVTIILDASDNFAPKTIEVAFVAKEPFLPEADQQTSSRYRLVYTISSEASMKAALKELVWLALLTDDRLRALETEEGTPRFELPNLTNANAEVGPSLMMERFLEFIRTSLDDVEYREEVETGKQKQVPIGLGVGNETVGAEAKVTLTGEYSVAYVLERGIVKGGREAPLEDYRSLTVPQPVDALIQKINTVKQQVTNLAAQYKARTRKDTEAKKVESDTAKLQTQTEQDTESADLLTVPFRDTSTPAQPKPYLPSETSGNAAKPHYGLGGFHTFTPIDGTLAQPAQLALHYEDGELIAGLDESTIRMYRWSGDQDDWNLVNAVLDTDANTVTATITDLGIYTLAQRMPSGSIEWTLSGNGTFTSTALMNNDGTPVGPGAVVHVSAGAAPISSPDVDPATDGVQIVTDANGQLQVTVQVPGGATNVGIRAFSDIGTAISDSTVEVPEP